MSHFRLGELPNAQRAVLLASFIALGCGAENSASSGDEGPGGADRRGIGQELAVARATSAPASDDAVGKVTSALTLPVAFPIDSRRSLFVSDQAIVSAISLKDVLSKLAGSSAGALTLYKKLWDLQNDTASAVTSGSHCSSTLNGFPVFCPTLEGRQASEADPFDSQNLGLANSDAYHAVALVNRVDLTATNGSDCGEFRMIFGKNPATGPQTLSRALVIFEAVLPNPKPTLGLVGCRDIQTFWAGLSDPAASLAQRAASLRAFFLDGAAGASPVVSFGNYTGGASGRIRTNQFFQDQSIDTGGLRPWVLKEFSLAHAASGEVVPRQVTTKANPFVGLFDNTRTDSLSNQFVDFLSRPDVVSALSVNDLNGFNYPNGQVPDQLNAGQSQSARFGLPNMNTPNDYFGVYSAGGATHRLRTRLQTTLTSLGSSLTPDNIVARAQSLSCGGCHIMSSETPQPPLGLTNSDGSTHPFPPVSTPFTHVDERTTGTDGRFPISAAVQEFLLFRQQVQTNFFGRTEGAALGASFQITSNWNEGYCANVTLANSSNTAFSVWDLRMTVTGAVLQTNWGSTASLQGSALTLLPPSYAAPVNAHGQYTFGFCVTKKVPGSAPQLSVQSAVGFRP